ncbi:MAG: T9SS C-terminal target domain-containing protein [Calditrichaeota bacterium]|nr:MAG: T9SS C-terminal target domain-containing protein [Calditrichota bacterium]
MKKFKGKILVMALVSSLAAGASLPAQAQSDLIISGVVDGPLTGGIPKAIELFVVNNISDLSIYGVGSANNGGGTDGEEFTFPAVAATAGDYIYVASEETGFISFFGFSPDYTSGAASINGDDAIELFKNGTVVDVFGDIAVDGSGQPWEYLDGWAKRISGTGPDGATFILSNWTFSGPNALDGETTNATAATPFPIIVPVSVDLLISGVVDGPLSGGVPKTVEFFVINNISDLSIYGFGSANNGGGTDGEEYTFPAVAASAGDFIYVASEVTGFTSFFGFAPNFTSSAANINGDDAIELFKNGDVVDVFGDIAVDGSGQPWEYLDGWAKRINGTGPDGASFILANWTFSGPNALDGESTNATAATPFPIDGGSLPTNLVINEVDADTPGSDALEFVELFDGGVGNTDLTGLVLVFFNGSDDASYAAYDLDGFSTDNDGYFLMGNAGVTPTPALITSNGSLQNGPDAVALFAGDASDFPNDTPVTTTNLLDAIVYDTNDADDAALLVLLNSGQPQVNEGGDGDSAGDSNQRIPNGSGGALNTDTYTQLPPTPGTENTEPPVVMAEIFEIQGSGLTSPFVGQTVITEDNVVTAVSTNGFFMQTPAARTDGNPETSDGILVFTGSAPTVAVGDQVDVTGPVVEFFDLTEISNPTSVSIDGSGNPLPAVVTLDENTPSPFQPQPANELERFEGMIVAFNGIATGPTDRFGDVSVVANNQRAYREPGIAFPGLSGLPVWDGNPEIFEINPNGLGLPEAALFVDQTVQVQGPLSYSFGDYQVLPSSLSLGSPPSLPVAVRSRTSEEVTIGTLNMFRLFEGTSDFQDRLNKFSLYIRNVMRAPEILAVQEVENIGALQSLANKIQSDDTNLNYSAYLIEGNDIGGIDVGFLVQNSIQVNSVTQLGKDEIFSYDGSLLNDRPALLLEAEAPTGDIIKVLNVHLRSLSGIEGSSATRVRLKRDAQATSVSLIVDSLQTSDPEVKLVVTGDFNAYQFTDGYVHVLGQIMGAPADASQALIPGTDQVDPNLTNEILSLPSQQQYSFNFGGSSQVLDHMLTSVDLNTKVTYIQYARGNSDAPHSFGANATTPLRASDHDGLVLYLDLVPPQITVSATPGQLWPVNHKYNTFSISDFVQSVTDAGAPGLTLADVYITSVSSDEPEIGSGDGNTLDDIVIVDCQTVDLRAERSGNGNGRVYTINVSAEDLNGNIGNAAFQVHVPKSKNGSPSIDDGPVYVVNSDCNGPSGQNLAKSGYAETLELPTKFALNQNYPNPFNPETEISFQLPVESEVTIKIYNALGQEVRTLVNQVYSAGVHRALWNARDNHNNKVTSGIYIYQINVGTFQRFKKMMFLQ